ncbi:protein phosphatase 1 regulatory subunit 15B [Coregonus clupeaformis]|uniref:protein phosphatase 1 regulatory subunit 15B n=1 Tax=Coregonus clupeaformis TaxID=59861 RepID=UPI001E1C70EF|nr:protein phosphatase 1 regulatory subunit 15B [Coregonus clupeaformis]
MFRNMNRGEHFSGVQTPPSTPAGHGVASLQQPNQESSWMGMFSVVSRPALSFLQKYLPGRPRTPALSDSVSGWVSGDFKQNFVEAESAFLGQLDILPGTPHHAHHLSYLQYQHGRLWLPVSGNSSMSWLTADFLSELGIRNAAEIDLHLRQQTPVGYLTTGFLSQVLLNAASSQEMKHAEQGHVLAGDSLSSDAVTARAKRSIASNWWGGLWGTDDDAQGLLSNLSSSKEGTEAHNHSSNGHCRQPECGTKAAVTMPTELFVQCNDGERTGPFCYKEEPKDNGSLQTATRTESLPSPDGLPLDHRETVCISSHIVSVAAVTACSELAVLTPDQDNGYSSLEEEHSTSRLYMLRLPCEELQGITEIKEETDTPTQGNSEKREPERDALEEREEGEMAATGGTEGEEEVEDSDVTDSEEEETAAAPPPSTPQCSNKAIAYIMGSPCSDDSQSDDLLSEDDDGFDSDGSSEFSDSKALDEDDDDDDEEEANASDSEPPDSETERLWNSLCQSRDPYNPQNFTAPLNTTPRTILSTPTAAAACSLQASPPEQPPSPFNPSSPSPAEEFGSGDESCSSEVDEAESLRLWNSFSFPSDPYSPFNFQVPLRTREPTGTGAKAGAGTRCKRSSKTTPCSPRHEQGQGQSQYRKEVAEERLDSGFSETLAIPETTTMGCVTVKRVCFRDEVEEFYASEDDEDRCGPWEELARDRARFLRRVQDVEDGISYVFSPTFRLAVYQRLQHHS